MSDIQERNIIDDLKQSIDILVECYHATPKQMDLMYDNANNIVDYAAKFYHIHRTEHKKIANLMLFVHNEYFKWVCNDIAESIGELKLDNPKAEVDVDLSEIPLLNLDEIKYVHSQMFHGLKPDTWVECLEKRLKDEVYHGQTK